MLLVYEAVPDTLLTLSGHLATLLMPLIVIKTPLKLHNYDKCMTCDTFN